MTAFGVRFVAFTIDLNNNAIRRTLKIKDRHKNTPVNAAEQ